MAKNPTRRHRLGLKLYYQHYKLLLRELDHPDVTHKERMRLLSMIEDVRRDIARISETTVRGTPRILHKLLPGNPAQGVPRFLDNEVEDPGAAPVEVPIALR